MGTNKAPWEEAGQATTVSAAPWEEAGSGPAAAPPHPTHTIQAQPTAGQRLLNLITHPLNELDSSSTMTSTLRNASLGEMVSSNLNNLGAGATSVIRHPVDTLKGMLAQGFGARPVVENAINAAVSPVVGHDLYSNRLLPSNPDEASYAAGQGLALAAAPHIPEVTGRALEAAGDAARAAGRGAGDLTLGTNALDRQYGARPGAGVSQNRVVAMTRPSLAAKVRGKVEPLKQAETEAIQNAPDQTPMNVRGTVNRPFIDINKRTTNPRTGIVNAGEQSALARASDAVNYQLDPATGKPLTVETPEGEIVRIPKPLESVSPVEASQIKSNMQQASSYDTPDSTLANQALKGGAANLREQIIAQNPSTAAATQQLHDTLAADDILRRQTSQGGGIPAPPLTLMQVLKNVAVDPALVTAGSSAASLLDLVGAGLQKAGRAFQPDISATVVAPSAQPQLPSSTGPGVVVTPPPTPTPDISLLPAESGPNIPARGQSPPNVRLTEQLRGGGKAGGYPTGPRPSTPEQGVGGAKGPVKVKPDFFGKRRRSSSFIITPKQLPAPIQDMTPTEKSFLSSLWEQIAGGR